MSPDIRQTLERRGVDPAGEHARLQSARLAPSLRLVARKIEDGELAGIDRLLRVLDRLDRYQTLPTPPPLDRQGAAARRDQRMKTPAGRRARDAAARAAGPAPASFCLQPSDFAQSAEKTASKNFLSERSPRPRPPARRPLARAASEHAFEERQGRGCAPAPARRPIVLHPPAWRPQAATRSRPR
jgi:hypothetical protein